jgi:cytidylate kinase
MTCTAMSGTQQAADPTSPGWARIDAVGDVIVVTGPPGAGKSTVSEELSKLLDPSALVTGDDFFAFLRSGAISPWREDAHPQNTAVIAAAAAATGRLADHCDVVYDGVLGPWFLETFLEGVRLEQLHYAVLLPPLEVCLDRVSSRVNHGFTDRDAAWHMWRDFDRADIDRRHVIDAPATQPAAVARALLRKVESGAFRYQLPASPR